MKFNFMRPFSIASIRIQYNFPHLLDIKNARKKGKEMDGIYLNFQPSHTLWFHFFLPFSSMPVKQTDSCANYFFTGIQPFLIFQFDFCCCCCCWCCLLLLLLFYKRTKIVFMRGGIEGCVFVWARRKLLTFYLRSTSIKMYSWLFLSFEFSISNLYAARWP